MAEKLAELEKKNPGINFALLVGHGTIREEVMGMADRAPTARARGVDVTFDQYPYVASGTSITGALVPRWAQEGGQAEPVKRLQDPATRARIRKEMLDNIERRGGPNTLFVARCGSDPSLEGKNLEEIGKAKGLAPVDAAIEIQIADPHTVKDQATFERTLRSPQVLSSGGINA